MEDQVRKLELGRGMKGLGGLPGQVLDEFTGGNGGSGEQKSCGYKDKITQISNIFNVILQAP